MMENNMDEDSSSTVNVNNAKNPLKSEEVEPSTLRCSSLFLVCLGLLCVILAAKIVYMRVMTANQQESIKSLITERRHLIEEQKMMENEIEEVIQDRHLSLVKAGLIQERLTQVREELNKEGDELRKKKEELSREKEELSNEKDELNKEKEELSRKTEELRKEKDKLSKEKEELRRKTEELSKEKDKLSEEKDKLSEEKDKLSEDKKELKKDKAELNKEREKLKVLTDEAEKRCKERCSEKVL
ncbi:PREDICTED: trichohyalin-like isoform X2 [Poecilia mexicana]|uniref:trichohyalin-like isoform X2 n=1 Tax=Poecilia mexicana TaxID=48701 RepID=UPI00072E66B8|nr:PREDICTED: trichohyalin-like isoform X2 [Poecilia mexicana]